VDAVDAVNGKDILGQVNANKDDAHGPSPSDEWMKSLRFPSWHQAAQQHNAIKPEARGTPLSFAVIRFLK